MSQRLIRAETAIQAGYQLQMAGKMGQAANCFVVFDPKTLKASPASDEFEAVIEEVNANDIEFADCYGIQAPSLLNNKT